MHVDNTILYFYASIFDPILVTNCGLMNCHTTHASNKCVDLLDKPMAEQNIMKIMPFPSNHLIQFDSKLMLVTFITSKRTQQL